MTTPPPIQPTPTPEQGGDLSRSPFVSRGGLKLEHALQSFSVDPSDLICADFGCNVGGFTDCLLQHGARIVHALDTGYGTLAWKLRNDPRVRVMERTNALHAPPPSEPAELPQLIVIDMAWTPQRLCMPAALRWLHPTPDARIISLIKPHYEVDPAERTLLQRGVLPPEHADRIARRVFEHSHTWGLSALAICPSPIFGGKSKDSAHGNTEYLGLFARATAN